MRVNDPNDGLSLVIVVRLNQIGQQIESCRGDSAFLDPATSGLGGGLDGLSLQGGRIDLIVFAKLLDRLERGFRIARPGGESRSHAQKGEVTVGVVLGGLGLLQDSPAQRLLGSRLPECGEFPREFLLDFRNGPCMPVLGGSGPPTDAPPNRSRRVNAAIATPPLLAIDTPVRDR